MQLERGDRAASFARSSAARSRDHPIRAFRRGVVFSCVLAGCAPEAETVYTLTPPTWFEDGWSYYDVSPDGAWAVYGARFGGRLIDLTAGREDTSRYASPGAQRAAGGPAARIAWGGEPPSGVTVPESAVAKVSPDGGRVAFFLPGRTTLSAGPPGAPRAYELDGVVTGLGWVTRGDLLYVLVLHADGWSTLNRLNLETGAIHPLREHLDAPPRFNALAVSEDSRTVYLALASDSAPVPGDRHRPDADRDTDIYAFDLASQRLQRVVAEPGDDFHPVIAGQFLYWTHNDFRDDVAVLPYAGGPARSVASGGQIPYWRPDGRELAYTVGGWRIADWALNLDAAVVALDDSARASSPPRPIVTGYHEDFTPAWSPDGTRIAFTSGDLFHHNLYVVNADGTGFKRLTHTSGIGESAPRWSPDGDRIAFDTNDPETRVNDIFIIDADGSNLIQLTGN